MVRKAFFIGWARMHRATLKMKTNKVKRWRHKKMYREADAATLQNSLDLRTQVSIAQQGETSEIEETSAVGGIDGGGGAGDGTGSGGASDATGRSDGQQHQARGQGRRAAGASHQL
jgi:hypothetical protein